MSNKIFLFNPLKLLLQHFIKKCEISVVILQLFLKIKEIVKRTEMLLKFKFRPDKNT